MFDIEVTNLKKSYGKGKKQVIAVDGVSFSVKRGEIFGLLGVNGAGKSTTINILTGLLSQDSGEVSILGKDPIENWEYVKNKVNVSTAYFPLSDVLTLYQNLKVYAKIYNVKNYKKKIKELLEMFELTSLRNTRVVNMSSGEKTRTALCKCLLNDPKVLFLDECTVGLDPDIAEKTRKIIKHYSKKKNTTILFTSHYMQEVEELCDRIAFMENGKIVRVATAKELRDTIKKRIIELTVSKDVQKLKKYLEKERMKILGVEGNTVTFEINHQKHRVYKTLSKIFEQGFHMEDVHIEKPTLEEVFIKFVRGEK